MENKGLNIFNAKYLLADPDTTTDDEYRHIEAVIAHEYFHNWSGNRVTCRDWFQLSLKEGFTVFREQQFCADMQSAALQRIDEVATLRRVQFPEDAGPLAHPVRPAEYTAIDNFYTPTVYEKGAELVRMIAGRLGPGRFRRGTDLYFSRHDGQAATIEDFLAALGEANGLDLSPYLIWYAQAGTPRVTATGDYDPVAHTYTLTLTQTTPPTPGQPEKSPLPIPVRVALFAADGRRIPMRMHDEPERVHQECVLELAERSQCFVFVQVNTRPVPSLLRNFSAPVQWQYAYAPRELALLLRHESEGYDRWSAGQQLAAAAYDGLHAGAQDRSSLDAWCVALAELFEAEAAQLDPALLADLLTPPSSVELGARHEPLDPERVHLAREALENILASRLGERLHARYQALHQGEAGALDSLAQAQRRLKGRVLALLLRADPRAGAALAVAQYEGARSMTDRLSAMAALVRVGAPGAEEVLRDFRTRYDGKPLVLDKWFALQAQVPARETLARVQALSADPAFSLHNPNRVQALVGAFARGNPIGFHRPDGEGYRYIAEKVVAIDALNPQNGARLAKSFESWHKLEPQRRALALATLQDMSRRQGLSRDLVDILARMLTAEGR
jgi:aminopeptidase N